MKLHPSLVLTALILTGCQSVQTPAAAPSPKLAATAAAKPAPATTLKQPIVEVPIIPLSDATKAKLAAMTPIFDGKSLAGWIQVPSNFGGGDILDLPSFAKGVANKTDPLLARVAEQLDTEGKQSLTDFNTGKTTAPKPVAGLLSKALTRVMAGPSVYDQSRFKDVKLRPETATLLQQSPSGIELMRLNRMLLEDAFPQTLKPAQQNAWEVKDGAMISTGAGRGTVCTAKDYLHYRLVFQIRHVTAEVGHDHQPCVLIFCQRPTTGTVPLDALGGIQFQVPNGGHWDYRPGFNNGGTGFVNPVKTGYDNHQWRQVEMLVNATTGEARMAVAPAEGMRGVENLDFKDPQAARVGPIAWQMHNAGLVDEFKDIRIEINPKEDRLITVE
jgi:hypothetical protein